MKRKAVRAIALFVALILLVASFTVSAAKPKKLSIYRGTPMVDGTIDTLYGGVEEIKINLHRSGEDAKNASGWAKVVWDDEFLYAVFNVTDKTIGSAWSQNKSYWATDSAELFLDEENNSAGDVPISQFRVDKEGKITGMLQHAKCDEANLRAEYGGFIGVVKAVTDGYVVEMAVPWTRITPKADTTKIGLAFQINDVWSLDSIERDAEITNATPSMWACETYYDYTLISDKAESLLESEKGNSSKDNGKNNDKTTGNTAATNSEIQQIINTTDLKTYAEAEGVKLEGAKDAFASEPKITVEKVSDTAAVESALGTTAAKFTAFDIKSEVKPSGKIKATFNTPEGYNTSKIAVLLIADGKATVVPFAVAEDGKTIIASLNSFGTYAVVEKSDSAIAEEDKNNDTDADTAAGDSAIDMNKILIIILISVIALCLVAIICMYIFVFKAKPASKK